jgi:hypothetical protein
MGIADFGSHALLHERTELALIVDLDQLLRPIGRVGDVELHLDGGCAVKTGARGVVDKSRRVLKVVEIQLTPFVWKFRVWALV